MNFEINITADYRENPSGIPAMLRDRSDNISIRELKAGDYLLDNQLLIERKTAEDFIQSLLSGRLFEQCKKLSESKLPLLMIIEGDIYDTDHRMSQVAINGALLAIAASWQIPVFYSTGKQDTVDTMIRMGKQISKRRRISLPKSKNSKIIANSQVYFLQGLPDIGPKLTLKLIRHFGSIRNIAIAEIKELISVEGIGKGKATKIFNFLRKELNSK